MKAMCRDPKPNGRKKQSPPPNSNELVKRVKAGGGRIEHATGGGSHFWVIDRHGNRIRAYETGGDDYPKGMACELGKWLAKAGLVIAFAVGVAALVSMC
jgi:hypothetical protein